MPTIEELKIYLGIDGVHSDPILTDLLNTAIELVEKVLRYEIDLLSTIPIVIKEAIKYAVAYLYTNRETADFLQLERMISILLSALRKEGF